MTHPDPDKVREAITEFEARLKSIPYHTDGVQQTEILLQAARAWLSAQETAGDVDIEALKEDCANFALTYWQSSPQIYGIGFKTIPEVGRQIVEYLATHGHLKTKITAAQKE